MMQGTGIMNRIGLSEKGFSLMELIMVIITVGIISAVIAPIFTWGFQAFFSARNLSAMSGGGELAMDRMSRELRAVDPSADFDSSVLPGTTQIKFRQYNGTAQAAWVTYSLSGTSLMRNSDLLAPGVASFNLYYFQSDGTALSPPLTLVQANSIWLVRIILGLSTTQASESLRTTVYLRSGPISR